MPVNGLKNSEAPSFLSSVFSVFSVVDPSAFEHVDLDWLDANALLLHPANGRFDLRARAVELEAHNADLVRHAGLPHVGHEREFLAQLPDERLGDEPRRIHEPEPSLLLASGGVFRFGRASHNSI